MVWTALQTSYFVLAPLSVFAGILLILLFATIQNLRRHPGWLILWQCIAQSILDLHWLSSSELLPHRFPSHSPSLCLFIGVLSVYAFLLACNYTACLCYFILVHLRKPLKSQSSSRMWGVHAACHATAITAALAVLAAGDIGSSIMTTCFIRSGSKAE